LLVKLFEYISDARTYECSIYEAVLYIHSTTFKHLVGHVERLEERIFTFWSNNTNTFRTADFINAAIEMWFYES